MIRLILVGHTHTYPVSDVLRLFFGPPHPAGDGVLTAGEGPIAFQVSSTHTTEGTDRVRIETILFSEEEDPPVRRSEVVPAAYEKREIKRQLYTVLSEQTGIRFPWGSLTGIRPTLVARECLREVGGNPTAAARLLSDRYDVHPQKAILAVETAQKEENVLARVPEHALCVYVSVPYCPSRCRYCSFTMKDNQADDETLGRYAQAVLQEADRLFAGISAPVDCVYIGGGTPTVLPAPVLDTLMTGLRTRIPATDAAEWTVEAGRPDSINREKLQILKDHEVGRVCINPQTMHDKTLERIGRHHTVRQTLDAYEAAHSVGFQAINMDLITGLPGETAADFARSFKQVLALEPENITVHTLAVKRKSRWAEQMRAEGAPFGIGSLRAPDPETAAMVASADARLHERGWMPYYLYRQKDAVGGLENTGYAKPGTECRYNVAMMGDSRSVLGIGCGAMTKKFTGNRVDRVPTVRNPALFMNDPDAAADKILAAWT